jgi:TetR/AcrR family transcriptional repressor of nem operon
MIVVIYLDDGYHLFCQEAWKGRMMRVSQDEKMKSRERIIASAARMVRAKGPDGTSVNDVMRDAGLTHGGFYRHFATKDDLLAAGLDRAFESFVRPLAAQIEQGDADDALAAFRELYLSDIHVAHPEEGCPITAAGSELGRAAAPVRQSFSEGASRMVSLLAVGKAGPPEAQTQAAIRELAMMVGAIIIARAGDRALAERVLAACRRPAGLPD